MKPTQIFVNLPVADLPRAVAFFAALGFGFDPKFTNADATCMIVADDIFVMLLVRPFFQTFTPKPICDAHAATEVLVCLSMPDRESLERMVARAIDAGARTPNPPQDGGFMLQHGFEDLDGHLWELVFMHGPPP